MSRFTPRPAVRKGQKARIAFSGPSGSGKTWTALEAAEVFAGGGNILVVDTERDSASLYADRFTFDTITWEPPYDPRELVELIIEQSGKYAVIVIDSLTHFWEGEGGTLGIVDAAAARARGNSYAGWKEGTPAQNDMYAGLLRAECHVIVTMRSKTEYVLEERNGKQVPRRVGMAPVQRAGIEYEFTITAELDHEHTLLVDKTRCSSLAGKAFKLGHTAEMAKSLASWLDSAEPLAGRAEIEALREQLNDAPGSVRAEFRRRFGSLDTLLASQVDDANALVALVESSPDPEPLQAIGLTSDEGVS